MMFKLRDIDGFSIEAGSLGFLPTTYFEAVNETNHFNATYEVMIEK
jgi:hypothetical protein